MKIREIGLGCANVPCDIIESFLFAIGFADPGYTKLADYAWYSGNSGGTTPPVGQKLPNPWGLYEMHGHVFEWCQDLYDAYPGGIAIDPKRPATRSIRVFRGGLW